MIVVGLSRAQAHELINNPLSARDPITETPADYGMPSYETLTLTASDKLKLAAWYIPTHNGAAVIVVHGYKGNRSGMLPQAAVLAKNGYGVMLLDLRAHGQSEGELITFGKYETRDLEAAYQYLLTRPDVDKSKIGILGNSMGAAIVILYAAQNPAIKATVADSAFASLQDSIGKGVEELAHLPAFPFAPLIEFYSEGEAHMQASEISAEAHIGQISPRAVLLMQGGQDKIIPPNNGDRLFAAAGQPKELWFEPQVAHTDFIVDMPAEYERRVIAFYDKYLLGE